MSYTIAPLTSDIQDAPLIRIPIEPSAENGLQKPSQVMIDKLLTVPRARIGQRIGMLERADMRRVNRALVAFLGLDEDAA